jgi:hypothetical protein
MPRLKAPRQATCHPDRRHRALGLCLPCYFVSLRRRQRDESQRHEHELAQRMAEG